MVPVVTRGVVNKKAFWWRIAPEGFGLSSSSYASDFSLISCGRLLSDQTVKYKASLKKSYLRNSSKDGYTIYYDGAGHNLNLPYR